MCPLEQEPKEKDLAGIFSPQIPHISGHESGVEVSKAEDIPLTRERRDSWERADSSH